MPFGVLYVRGLTENVPVLPCNLAREARTLLKFKGRLHRYIVIYCRHFDVAAPCRWRIMLVYPKPIPTKRSTPRTSVRTPPPNHSVLEHASAEPLANVSHRPDIVISVSWGQNER